MGGVLFFSDVLTLDSILCAVDGRVKGVSIDRRIDDDSTTDGRIDDDSTIDGRTEDMSSVDGSTEGMAELKWSVRRPGREDRRESSDAIKVEATFASRSAQTDGSPRKVMKSPL
jgi:hypothetical protein